MNSKWTATKVDGKTAITVNGLTWRGSYFFSGPDNDDLDRSGVFGLTRFERERFDIVARVLPDDLGWQWEGGDNYIGVTVDAYKAGIELGNAALWGIDAEHDDRYLSDLARELADEAVAEARANLKTLCEED